MLTDKPARKTAFDLRADGTIVEPDPNDPIEWKIHLWDRILPGRGFDRIEAAARILQLAGGLVREMDRIAKTEGLINQGDYQVLSILRISRYLGEDMTITEVAAKLVSTTATIVNRVDRLEALGYVQRKPHPTDRRSLHLAITPEGVACVQRIVVQRTQRREQWLSTLTDEERIVLTELLGKLSVT